MIDNRGEEKAAESDKRCVRSRKKRQESVSQSSSSSEEQCNQPLKMVVTIAQGGGVEFQHAVFYYKRFKEC